MNVNYVISLFLILLLCSCGKKKEVIIPEYVFPKDSMTMILKDMVIIEAGLNTLSVEGKNVNPMIVHYYNGLLKKYKMDTTRLSQSLDFYASNPEILGKIYQETLDDLIQEQSRNKYNK